MPRRQVLLSTGPERRGQDKETVMTDQTPQSECLEGDPREIARLNDCLREHVARPGNDRVVMTVGVAELIGDVARCGGFRNVPRCCARSRR